MKTTQPFRGNGERLDEAFLEELRRSVISEAESPADVLETVQGAAVFLIAAKEEGDDAAVLMALGWIESFEPYFREMNEQGLLPDGPGLMPGSGPLQAPKVGDKPQAGMLSLRDLMPPKKIR